MTAAARAASRRGRGAQSGIPQVEIGPPLPREFYARPVLEVARDCIGKLLVHRSAQGVAAGRIVECEAYRGPEDLAAHSARGRRTARTEVMFGPPGHAYMFLLYGMHWAFNAVAGQIGQPHAVLVRALEPVHGVELMSRRRGVPAAARALCNGPGKLSQALGLSRADYGRDLCDDHLCLTEDVGADRAALTYARGRIGRSPRINVDYAGAWAARRWRFYVRGNPYVSVPPRH